MSLINKIDFFTNKRIQSIKKYITEIEKVQLVKKQLGGTEESIQLLLRNLDIEVNNLSELSTKIYKAFQQILEANTIIEELKRENKTCNENLLKKTQEMEQLTKEILEKYRLLDTLRYEQLDELFKVKISKYGSLSYYESLPIEIKDKLKTLSTFNLEIFFRNAKEVPASDTELLNDIIRTIEVSFWLTQVSTLPYVIESYNKLDLPLRKRLNKLPFETIQARVNGATIERTKIIDTNKLNKLLTELDKV